VTELITIDNPWLGIAVLVTALLLMLVGLRAIRARFDLHPELMRKMAHVGLGLTTLSFPWLFQSRWPVIVMGALATGTLLALRFIPQLRASVGGVVHGVHRSSGGDLYFPIAATGLFLLANGNWVLYVLPMLTLTLADAVAAIIGVAYGRHAYGTTGEMKSVEGSLAFFIVAFIATGVPLLLFTTTGRVESVLIGATFGVLVMLLEAIAWRGLDNLFIPFGGLLLLRAFLVLDAPALLARFVATVGLLVLVVLMRRRRTLDDYALVAGVLIGYVAWSAGGWRWLVPPCVLFAAYTVLWPRRSQLRERPHDMIAVFSVTGTGMVWLLLALVLRRSDLYYPYTLAYSANLCFIGITWYRNVRRSASRAGAVATSAVVAWAAFFVPYLAVVGLTRQTVLTASLGLVPLIIAGLIFSIVVPDVRRRPSTGFPWATQALVGLGSSALGLAILARLSSVEP
jgi:phytol kinase